MKSEHFVLAAVSLLLMSCSSDVINEPPVQLGEERVLVTNLFSSNRSLDEIHSFAMDATGYLTTGNTSRSDMKREIDKERGIKCITKGVSRAEASTDTLIYIVNYKDNAGFAVISARRSAEPILAVVGKGSYDSVVKSGNTGFNLFMNMAADYVSQCPEESPYSTLGIDDKELFEFKRDVYVIASDTVSPRVQVQWGQNGIYGKYFNNGYAGCNNVAAGMAMSYFEYPKTIEITHKNPIQVYNLYWKNIKRHIIGKYDFCCWPNSPHEEIGLLLYEIGFRSDCDDTNSEEGTSTKLGKTMNTLKSLGYKVSDYSKYTIGCIQSNLKNGIILIRGDHFIDSINTYVGHMWIADGYKYRKEQVVESIRPLNSAEPWEEIMNVTNEFRLSHFNWGWDGIGDDYYNDNVFSPKNSNYDFKYRVLFFTINR